MSIEAVLNKIDSGEILADEINDYVHEHFDNPEAVLRVIREQLYKPRKVRSRRFGYGQVIIGATVLGYDCVLVDFDDLYKLIVDSEQYLEEEQGEDI
jgi:hypothetical protein